MGKKGKHKGSPTEPSGADEVSQTVLDDLLEQLESRDPIIQTGPADVVKDVDMPVEKQVHPSQRRNPKSRFKARQLRKAAARAQNFSPDDPEVNARLEQEARDERESITRTCDSMMLEIHEINPDGHCLFSSVADQLAILNILTPPQANYTIVRVAAANYMLSHPHDFLPFLSSTGGDDGSGALDASLMTTSQFEEYCSSMRDKAVWGGEPEILALSRAFDVPIHVVQGGRPSIVKINAEGNSLEDEKVTRVVRISYHRKLFGLGEHYNSLRPKRMRSPTIQP